MLAALRSPATDAACCIDRQHNSGAGCSRHAALEVAGVGRALGGGRRAWAAAVHHHLGSRVPHIHTLQFEGRKCGLALELQACKGCRNRRGEGVKGRFCGSMVGRRTPSGLAPSC